MNRGGSKKRGWQDDWESRYGSTLLLGEQALSNSYDDTQRSPEGPRHLHRIPRLSEAPWEAP